MPLYHYEDTKTGDVESHIMTIAEMEVFEGTAVDGIIPLDGREVERVHLKPRRLQSERHWKNGLKSDALGVHPRQIPEAEAHARKIGVPIQFDRRTGQAIFTSRRQRKDYCQAVDVVDRCGGYGDAT